MGGDDYVILINTKYSRPYEAALDLNDQVTSLKQAVIRLVEIYEEAYQEQNNGDRGAMLIEHIDVIAAARSLVS